jgi:hypothetical protein
MPDDAPLRRLIGNRYALGVAFFVVQAVVGWRALQLHGLGDVRTYSGWAAHCFVTGDLLGITHPWVYPVLALPPILLAGVFGSAAYLVVWVAITTASDAVVVVLLARRDLALGWWFLLVVLLLGPVTHARIDEVVLPFTVGGVLLIRSRPALAAVLFTLGAWIKVWPALLVIALLVAGRRRLAVLGAAAGTCTVVIGSAVALGASGGTLFSFIGTQSSRGLQIEAPAAAPFLWSVATGQHGARIYFDKTLLTEQVAASGTHIAAIIATPILAAGVLIILGLAVRGGLRGAPSDHVLALTAMSLLSAVIALNKVGSPQYITWYVAPVVLGLITMGRQWWFPAVAVPATALLTQVIYPTAYPLVLRADPALLAVLDLRDLLELALLAWALLQLLLLRRTQAQQRWFSYVAGRRSRPPRGKSTKTPSPDLSQPTRGATTGFSPPSGESV